MNRRTKVTLVVVILILIVFFIYNILRPKEGIYERPLPAKVVEQYFKSWNEKDYVNMYAAISDGFKRIEPSANTLERFKEYASSQNINGVNIILIKEKSNDEVTAQVDYSVEFILENGIKQKFDGIFTLKYRNADIIQGWKLIHPYGEKIDES